MIETIDAASAKAGPRMTTADAGKTDAIRRSFALLHEPGDVFEIRALDVPMGRNYRGTVSGYYDDPNRAAQDVLALDKRGAAGVYHTMNPCLPALLARSVNRLTERPKHATTDADILRRRWLLLDIDPDRPSGVAATEAEKRSAQELAADVEDWLRAQGWDYPLIADSGNGVYLFFAVDWANDSETADVLKRFYANLNGFLPPDDAGKPSAHIDVSVYNAARIVRVGGTTNRKGDSIPDRPHRHCEYYEPLEECPIR